MTRFRVCLRDELLVRRNVLVRVREVFDAADRERLVRYLQLAHNEWDLLAGVSRTKVLYSFGREDQLDRAAVKRLVGALSRLLSPAEALAATAETDLAFTESRPLGGVFVLDGLWRRLGIDTAIRALLAARRHDERAVERVLFASVANRALKPSSKLAEFEQAASLTSNAPERALFLKRAAEL